MSENLPKKIDFEKLLQATTSLPLVHIDRKDFLQKELNKYCTDEVIKIAIEYNPAYAGISSEIINKIADSCIDYETLKVSSLSFASGLPGGFGMIAAIPADLVQYYAHILRIMQKLAYLYGWKSLIDDEDKIDDETNQLLTLFTGVMFGVKGAVDIVTKLSTSIAQRISKTLASKALTKGVIYPIVKKVATILGVKMTKEIFAKSVSKIIPVVGGVISGGITFISYKPMSIKFKKYLSGLNLASVDYYNNLRKRQSNGDEQPEIIDVDFSDIEIENFVEEQSN